MAPSHVPLLRLLTGHRLTPEWASVASAVALGGGPRLVSARLRQISRTAGCIQLSRGGTSRPLQGLGARWGGGVARAPEVLGAGGGHHGPGHCLTPRNALRCPGAHDSILGGCLRQGVLWPWQQVGEGRWVGPLPPYPGASSWAALPGLASCLHRGCSLSSCHGPSVSEPRGHRQGCLTGSGDAEGGWQCPWALATFVVP